MKRITQTHPEHRFIFLFDRPFDPRFIFSKNVEGVVVTPAARHPLLWKWWYDYKIPAVLKKYKADVFVSADGFCSLKTKKPQCLMIHDIAWLHFPGSVHRSHFRYYKKNTPRFIRKAKTIATVSQFSKDDLIKAYKTEPEKIDVVYNGISGRFGPLDYAARTEIRNKYTAGREYFLYTGAIHPRKNLVNLLKAFSLFKKRQQSQMKLVLAGRMAWKNKEFGEKLRSYKYREDVILTGYLEENELSKLTAAAYAQLYVSLFEGFGVPVIESMKAGVAVITSAGTAMEEIAQGAALFADPSDPSSIADQMKLIYKDEKLKTELIEKGRVVAEKYNWETTASLFWNCIEKAMKKE